MRRAARALVGAVAAAALLGCGSTPFFPSTSSAIEGQIVGLGDGVPFARGSVTTMWVKEDPSDECGIVFETREASIAARRPFGTEAILTFEDLAVGQSVRAWAPFVMDSCPGQAFADVIEVR